MADCRACGAPIDWRDLANGGGRVALDAQETTAPAADRWLINDDGQAEPVDEHSGAGAYVAHRAVCPYWSEIRT